jgi:hypothetical protein
MAHTGAKEMSGQSTAHTGAKEMSGQSMAHTFIGMEMYFLIAM